MAGSAILDPNVLVDSLVPDVIDGLREDLHPQFGVRAYRLFTVHRTWTGRMPGEGTASDVEVELRPQPKVRIWDVLRNYELEPCGLDDVGMVRVSEISLTYTQAELDGGGALSKKEEWFLRLEEAHGQESRSVMMLHDRTPYIDREMDMGWVMWLRVAS